MDMYDFRMFLRECIKQGQYEELVKILREENIIQSEEKPQGKWICEYRTCKCSVCGFATVIDTYNFCPNCGADMRGTEE